MSQHFSAFFENLLKLGGEDKNKETGENKGKKIMEKLNEDRYIRSREKMPRLI